MRTKLTILSLITVATFAFADEHVIWQGREFSLESFWRIHQGGPKAFFEAKLSYQWFSRITCHIWLTLK